MSSKIGRVSKKGGDVVTGRGNKKIKTKKCQKGGASARPSNTTLNNMFANAKLSHRIRSLRNPVETKYTKALKKYKLPKHIIENIDKIKPQENDTELKQKLLFYLYDLKSKEHGEFNDIRTYINNFDTCSELLLQYRDNLIKKLCGNEYKFKDLSLNVTFFTVLMQQLIEEKDNVLKIINVLDRTSRNSKK
jgi:hypothetical protein